jgi:hypothetical protein
MSSYTDRNYLTYSLLSNLIDDEYEDLCYNLAYTTEANIIAIANAICGTSSKTHILKSLLKNRDLYNKILMLNENNKHTLYATMIELSRNINIYNSIRQSNAMYSSRV